MAEVEESLLPSRTPIENKEEKQKNNKWLLGPVLLATAYVGKMALFSLNNSPKDEELFTSSSSLIINVDSGYGQPSSITRGFYPDIKAIVEPYRVATFSVSSETSSLETSTLSWSVVEETIVNENERELFDSIAFSQQDDKSIYYSPSFSLEPKFHVQNEVKLESTDSVSHHEFGAVAGKRILISVQCSKTGEKTSMVVHGKYVRRELRSLSEKDSELYLSAMHTVYTTDTKTGIEKYGDSYLGYDYFAYHHLGPAQLNHPWHNTPVFFTSHSVFSAQFETSMQLIEPSVSMCYWDFVEDSEKYSDVRTLKNGWAESDIWSSKWFGPMAFSEDGLFETKEISNTEKRLSGRWGDLPMCMSASEDLGQNGRTGFQYNSYALSRDVNNNNPAMFATRSFEICGLKTTSMGLPGCYELLGALNSPDMPTFHSNSEGGLHNSLHPKLGGAWECGYDFRHLEHRMKTLGKEYPGIISDMVTNLQGLWRIAYFTGELVRPEHCELSTPFEECQLSCSDLESELAEVSGVSEFNGNWHASEPSGETLSSDRWDAHFRSKVVIGKDHPTVKLDIDIDEETGRYYFTGVDKDDYTIHDEIKAALVVGTCRPGKIGEFMGPLGAAQDPMFFPIHSQFERAWHYMRIVKGMSSEWNIAPAEDDPSSSIFTPTGWAYDDPVEPFTEIFGVKRSPLGTMYTNQEIAAMVNPVRSQFLPFIYADTSFDVCAYGLENDEGDTTEVQV
jgi:hypothetical protein